MRGFALHITLASPTAACSFGSEKAELFRSAHFAALISRILSLDTSYRTQTIADFTQTFAKSVFCVGPRLVRIVPRLVRSTKVQPYIWDSCYQLPQAALPAPVLSIDQNWGWARPCTQVGVLLRRPLRGRSPDRIVGTVALRPFDRTHLSKGYPWIRAFASRLRRLCSHP